MLDLLIRNGTVVTPQGSYRLDVGVADGRVAGLYATGTAPEHTSAVDAAGLLVLPGAIDAHVHTRAPFRPDREQFDAATSGAAAGGVTTICEMPMSLPPTNSAAVVRARREFCEQEGYVDFALWGAGGVSPDDLAGMAEEGVCAFKIFLHAPMPGREREFEGLYVSDNYGLYKALSAIRETGLYCALHAEDNDLIRVLEEDLKSAGRSDPAAHCESRPPFVEHIAVSKLLMLAGELESRLYLPHISTAGAVAMAREAKAEGVDVVVETCPHYLLCDDSVMERVGPYGKINPPVRDQEEVDGLWDGLLDGTVNIWASDHSGFTVDEKEPFWNDIWRAFPGHPGIETLVPLLLDQVVAGRLPVERAVAVLADGPARAFGFFPRKGAIVPGADADLVLFDPRGEWRIQRQRLFTKARELARLFDGMTLRGRVTRTYVRGELVYDGESIVGRKGHARFVRPI